MPKLLDLRHVLPAHLSQRLLGEPRGDADAKAAGNKLQKRVAAGGIEPVEPALDEPRAFQPRGGVQLLDDLGEARHLTRLALRRPDEGDRLGEIADIVIGIAEEHFVHALHDERAQHRRLDARDREIAGQRRERIAAVGIGRGAEIIGKQPELAVPGGRQDEAVEKRGEGLHEGNIGWGLGMRDWGIGDGSGDGGVEALAPAIL